MELSKKVKSDLEKKFQKVSQTPASFAFFEAIHDFIKHIELTPALAGSLSYKTKINREMNIPAKYAYLRQIYQGLEDAQAKTDRDLGHARYMTVRDLGRIKSEERSDSNFFWRKRELFRKITGEVYERLRMD